MQAENSITSTISGRFLKKRLARFMAIQAIYSLSIEGATSDADTAIYNVIRIYESPEFRESFTESNERFLIELVRGAAKSKESLESTIQEHIDKKWKFSRLSKVLQAILKVAAFEVLSSKDTDVAVIINEYLEITKDLNHGTHTGFVNKVLDLIAKQKIL